MKNLVRGLLVAAVLCGGAALAQVQVTVGFPTIHFEAPPPLVVVDTGVQVVPDQEQEVFFTNGWYWTRSDDGRWYRSRNNWRWQPVAFRRVPLRLVRIPHGHYRRWHRPMPIRPAPVRPIPARGYVGREEIRHERYERRREREERREDRREDRRERRHERHEHHHDHH
jgi:hypothetical protein